MCATNTCQEEASPASGPDHRKFRFLELFAGHAGFSGAVKLKCKESVEVGMEQDYWTTSWDILVDSDFERARRWVKEVDHVHFAPPCRSFTRARRRDKFGSVPILRTDENPKGWGHPLAEEGNKVGERTAILMDEASEGGATTSTENPFDSFLWEQTFMARHVKRMKKVELHQCVYGAEVKKPTAILTDAPWMEEVNGLCQEAPEHQHLPGGLSGKTFDYSQDPPVEVWKTSLASEYPTGLCWAWATALSNYLQKPEVKDWLSRTTTVVTATTLKQSGRAQPVHQAKSRKEERELENQKAIGGLRDPYKAVLHNGAAWKVGATIRHALLTVIRQAIRRGENPQKIGTGFQGFSERTVEEAATALAREMKVEAEEPSPIRVSLLEALLKASRDAEEDVTEWLRTGFPLGIDKELKVNRIFPITAEDTKAVEESRRYQLLTEACGVDDLENYKSFAEAGGAAIEELDRIAAEGYATKCTSWEEVTRSAGDGASLTRLGCIQKTRPDGSVKTRLVVDCRRSGVNGLMTIRQRVVLPRVSEVAGSWAGMMRASGQCPMEFAVVDFQDAFYQCRLAQEERKHVVVKATGTIYYILEVVAFGLACGPLLWSRLAAALLRLAQAAGWDRLQLQCYVDDPVLLVSAPSQQERSIEMALPLLLWQSLGCKLSWSKLQRGSTIQWIGFQLQLTEVGMVATLAQDKATKLQTTLEELLDHKGVIAVQKLRSAAGLLGWLTSIVKHARPWVGMIWGSITECEARQEKTARVRKNLVFLKQVEMALRTLLRLTVEGQLTATFHWEPKALWTIQTDASVQGFGGILWRGNQAVTWWADSIEQCDLDFVEGQLKDPAWQSEWELMAVVISVRVFSTWLKQQAVHLLTDNTGVLSAALTLRATSPGMVVLAAELACALRASDIELSRGSHLRSAANYLADALSRIPQGAPVPAQLREVARCKTEPRDQWWAKRPK